MKNHGEHAIIQPAQIRDWSRAGSEQLPIVASSSGSSETRPGSALGSPGYMSPEQARGDIERVGPRSAVYGLGATLFCLLTGRPPFEGDDIGGILIAVREGRFSQPTRLDPSIDRTLDGGGLPPGDGTQARGPLLDGAMTSEF